MARWEQVINDHHCGYGNKNTDYNALVREIPLSDEDLSYFEGIIHEAATGGQASYDCFPDEGGIDIAAALLAEVRRLTMEELIKQAGFENLQEFNRMVANVDISTHAKLAAFKNWQNEDGSKEGLLKLSAMP